MKNDTSMRSGPESVAASLIGGELSRDTSSHLPLDAGDPRAHGPGTKPTSELDANRSQPRSAATCTKENAEPLSNLEPRYASLERRGLVGVGGVLPPVLDACCASRMFWYDREDSRAVFMDIREGEWSKDYGTEKTAGRSPIVVRPDVLGDFTAMPFPDASFQMVVFDPPHHTSAHFGSGDSIIKRSYGMLLPGWEQMLAAGFAECFRVLKPGGTLVFKWGSREIPLARILALTPHRPLFGHTTGAKATTHWCVFLKAGGGGAEPVREDTAAQRKATAASESPIVTPDEFGTEPPIERAEQRRADHE